MHIPVHFPGFPGSYALVADRDAPDGAVMFVHGFGGDSVDTWQQLQTLIEDPRHAAAFQGLDLFFYDYPSTRYSIKDAAERFGRFVRQMLEEGPLASALAGRTLPGLSVPKASNRGYPAVLLVGHSLGGVIVRKLVVGLAKASPRGPDGPVWPIALGRRPRLFAPAHAGFLHGDVASLLASLTRPSAALFALWRIKRARAYADLQAGNPVLTSLRDQTIDLATRHADCPAFRAVVLWGRDENVVFNDDYPADDTKESVAGRDHRSVCKPAHDYPLPLEFIRDGMA